MGKWWDLLRGRKHFEIYTDGSFKNGRGAWAYVIVRANQVVLESSGSTRKTSSNAMELQAAIEALTALQSLRPRVAVKLFSDSRILVDTMTRWIPDWKISGWQKKSGRAIPYLKQIQNLDRLNQQYSVEWYWIKAHSGIVHNERCDQLCVLARSR